jgi:transcriptional regulator with XRE-family HTH domain
MKVFIKSELEAKKIGMNIQIARKRRNLSLADLSAKSSVSKTVVRRIENGDVSVGIGKVFNVLDALGLLIGISDIASPDLDREQAIAEIKALREGGRKNSVKKNSNLVRFGDES